MEKINEATSADTSEYTESDWETETNSSFSSTENEVAETYNTGTSRFIFDYFLF